MELSWEKLLRRAAAAGASDLHISAGVPPMARINGRLAGVGGYPALTAADTLALAEEILTPGQLEEFKETGDRDFSHALRGLGRFRISCFFQRGTVGMVVRLIGSPAPTLEELGLPPILHDLIQRKNGLLVISGPSGSGKSTSLAAIIAEINRKYSKHCILLEDPIEYQHSIGKSIISQREIGLDCSSYGRALRAALRQDPDVIMVGEMRDLETISTVITAAETGHLVLTSLHTASAPQSIERIIDVFPPHQQQQVRLQLANSLIGIISQLLLARMGGGRALAVEVLVANAAVRNLIREGKVHQIGSIMQISGHLAMSTMDSSLKDLLERGIISGEEAASYTVRGEGMGT